MATELLLGNVVVVMTVVVVVVGSVTKDAIAKHQEATT